MVGWVVGLSARWVMPSFQVMPLLVHGGLWASGVGWRAVVVVVGLPVVVVVVVVVVLGVVVVVVVVVVVAVLVAVVVVVGLVVVVVLCVCPQVLGIPVGLLGRASFAALRAAGLVGQWKRVWGRA